MMITALLVDDEPRATTRLAELLDEFRDDVEVIGTASDVADARRFLAGRTPDVVFLDIDMPGGSGFDLVASVPASSRIVFVTAAADRALDAFGVGAMDYLHKPVERSRLAATIDRLLNRPDPTRPPPVASAPSDTAATKPSAGSIVLVHAGTQNVETVRVADVIWVEGCRNYSRVVLRGRQPLLVRRTMKEWETVLEEPVFGRIDRSLIIQVAAVQATRWQSRDQTLIVFRDLEQPLPIGRAATVRLKQILAAGG